MFTGKNLVSDCHTAVASVMTLDYLKLEAAKGNRSDFERFMNLILNAPTVPGDEFPD
jgi:hypothetical protein